MLTLLSLAATGILQPGDVLLSMNGESMAGKTLNDVILLARQASRMLILDVGTLKPESKLHVAVVVWTKLALT